ncbi:hypothetical protein SDC9_13811 [bioreactor metagenome]|uniref:Uncharacterized protein n=1 Tax=bioreactor metagenome TaxID=1076179 RepID=A0A644TMA5_9ZZZZ
MTCFFAKSPPIGIHQDNKHLCAGKFKLGDIMKKETPVRKYIHTEGLAYRLFTNGSARCLRIDC